ncbi:TolC family protein [Thermodesulfobacteriota bacterium]
MAHRTRRQALLAAPLLAVALTCAPFLYAAEEKIDPPGLPRAVIDQWRAGPLLPVHPLIDEPAEFGRTEERGIPISVSGCIEILLQNSLELASRRQLPLIQDAMILTERGRFDVNLYLDSSYTLSSMRSSSILSGASSLEKEIAQYDLGARRLMKTGTVVDLKFETIRLWTNSYFFNLNPSYETRLSLSIVQPLLRGGGPAFGGSRVALAENLKLLSIEAYEKLVAELVAAVETSYWDLVFAGENLQVKKDSLALARSLLEDNKNLIDIGAMAPTDIHLSETRVAQREEEVLLSENAVFEMEDRLIKLVDIDPASIPAGTRLIPSDRPVIEEVEIDLEDGIERACEARPEIRSARLDLKNKELGLGIAENALLPELSIVGGVALSGLAGHSTPFDPLELLDPYPRIQSFLRIFDEHFGFDREAADNLSGGYGDSIEELFTGDNRSWNIGLRLSVPLGNRTARGQYARAKLEYRQALLTAHSLERQIALEIRQAIRHVESAGKRIDTTRSATTLAGSQLDAEEKKRRLGLSTNFRVLQAQEDLSLARTAELKSRIDYLKARIRLELVTAALLDSRGIRLDEDYSIRF